MKTYEVACPECGFVFDHLGAPTTQQQYFSQGMCFQCYKEKVKTCTRCGKKDCEVFYVSKGCFYCSDCVSNVFSYDDA